MVELLNEKILLLSGTVLWGDYPSSYPAFEKFLLKSGVKKRLSSKDLPSVSLSIDNQTVGLRFTSSYAEYYGNPRSEGLLFLEIVSVRNPKYIKKTGPLTSKLPFGLHIDMTENDIILLLGNPSKSGEAWGRLILTYKNLIEGMVVDIDLDIKSREIMALSIDPQRIDLQMDRN